jgi:hypothetical protein
LGNIEMKTYQCNEKELYIYDFRDNVEKKVS